MENKYGAIVIGGSAGSFQPVIRLLTELSSNFSIPIILSLHRLKHVRHGFLEALANKTLRQVIEPNDKERIRPGVVYLAPANYHLMIEAGRYFSLSTEEMVNNSRPSIDVTFTTASEAYRSRLIGILLSGANKDGAKGMKAISKHGGLTIVQSPADSAMNVMPKSAIDACEIDHVKSVEDIINFLKNIL